MKKNVNLKPIDTKELDFKNKDEFLKWREKKLYDYEQSKIEYNNEMKELFGYTDEQDN